MSEAKAPLPSPSPDEIGAVALPAVVRRSPRLARFVTTGALAGIALGILLGILMPGAGAPYRVTVTVLVALGFGFLGALAAGAIATRRRNSTNEARVGTALGLGLAATIVMLTWPGEYTRTWALVSVVVMVGIPFFGSMIGASFAPRDPMPAAIRSSATKPSATKPATKTTPAKKPAAKNPARSTAKKK